MKNRLFAALLAFVLGYFGINNFYVGEKTKGIWDCILTVLFCWTGVVPFVIYVINLVRGCAYLWCNSDEEFNKIYVK